MNETATISRTQCDRPCAEADDLADLRAALAAEASIQAGTEELVPAAVADRIVDGANRLKVWREHRSISQTELARTAGINRVQIADIQADRATGSVRTLTALAEALGATIDDLVT